MYWNVTFALIHQSNESISHICIGSIFWYFVFGVPDRSYSPLIMNISLVDYSEYEGCTPRMVLNHILRVPIKEVSRRCPSWRQKFAWSQCWVLGTILSIGYNIGYLVPYLELGRDIGDIGFIIGVRATQFGHVFQEVNPAEVDIHLERIRQGKVGMVTVSLLIWL